MPFDHANLTIPRVPLSRANAMHHQSQMQVTPMGKPSYAVHYPPPISKK